jgi:hypothetical protein
MPDETTPAPPQDAPREALRHLRAGRVGLCEAVLEEAVQTKPDTKSALKEGGDGDARYLAGWLAGREAAAQHCDGRAKGHTNPLASLEATKCANSILALVPPATAQQEQLGGKGGRVMKIYLASSWRNTRQADVLAALRGAGHEVYDFKNPVPGDNGFSWRWCDPRPPSEWSVEDYLWVLEHPVAQRGFGYDMSALEWSDTCVLVLPCGRSAHMEFGWAVGAGKRGIVLCEKLDEPELMYLMAGRAPRSVIVSTVDALLAALAESSAPPQKAPLRPPKGLVEALRAADEAFADRPRCEVPVDGEECGLLLPCEEHPASPEQQLSGSDK